MRWDFGLDMGTAFVRMTDISATLLDESAVLAFHRGERAPFACGDEAGRLEGRVCENMYTDRPLVDGTLRDPYHAGCLAGWAVSQTEAADMRRFGLLAALSPDSRPVQANAMLSALLEAGAFDAGLVRADAAAAIGAGLDVLAPQASMVVHLGAGRISATLFTMGRVAQYASLPYGMQRIDQRIQRAVRTGMGYSITLMAAEELKLSAGAAALTEVDEDACLTTAGLNMCERLPRVFDADISYVLGACTDIVREIMGMVAGVVDQAPPELAADLTFTGITLTGGGALLRGLDTVLTEELGIPCRVAEAPMACVTQGLRKIMQQSEDYAAFFIDKASANTWR